jgi:hypothetical protein
MRNNLELGFQKLGSVLLLRSSLVVIFLSDGSGLDSGVITGLGLGLAGTGLLVDGNNNSTTKTNVVLKSILDIGDLAFTGPTTKLPDKFYCVC